MSLVLCLVARSCLTLCDPVDCIPPGSSVLGVFQARMSGLPFSFSRGSSPPRDPTRVSCLSCFAGRFFTCWATGEAPIISLENTNWIDIVLCSEKAMAPHSRTLAWKIPWMEEPGRLQSWGRAWLSDFTFTFNFHALEKEVASHSSVLAWRIPGMGKPGGLPSMGSHRVEHNWGDLAIAIVLCCWHVLHCVFITLLNYT